MSPYTLDRRSFLHGMAGLGATALLAACGSGRAPASAQASAATSTLPSTIPPGTQLTIAGGTGGATPLYLRLAGLIDTIPFRVTDWPNVTAGPDVINAFRARSLDVGSNAGIPPIQAEFQGGIDARIVAVNLTRRPTYVFVTKPKSDVQDINDFNGKSIAFSQGQAQGLVVLRALKEAGLTYGGSKPDVKLVPLTSDQFLTALQAGYPAFQGPLD